MFVSQFGSWVASKKPSDPKQDQAGLENELIWWLIQGVCFHWLYGWIREPHTSSLPLHLSLKA